MRTKSTIPWLPAEIPSTTPSFSGSTCAAPRKITPRTCGETEAYAMISARVRSVARSSLIERSVYSEIDRLD
jgi:hypothetical protein